MCTPSMPGQGNTFWSTGAPGMTAEETKALPRMDPELIAWGGITAVAERGRERTAALEKWKAENPERYQEGLREQERANQPAQQAPTAPATPAAAKQDARSARKGAGGGGGGGGGSSSQNTLLTPGAPEGIEPGELNLAKTSLLGL